MANNPNEALKQLHTLYCAGSGGGKTTAVHHLGIISPQSSVVIFDPYGTFTTLNGRKVERIKCMKDFYTRLAWLHHRNKPFVLSFYDSADPKVFDLFCRIVWSVADGDKILNVVCDEMIRYLPSATAANEGLKEILQGGRKFGLIFHGLFQRAQEVPKTIVRGCARKWIGKPDSMADARYWSDEIDVDPREIGALNDLEYYFKSGGIGSTTKGRLKPLKR